MTDDQDLGSMEHMPIVSREVADRGVEFTQSYVALSECCPSRASFLTGQHAHNHGVVANKPPNGGYPALDGSETLAVWLDEQGYRTAQIGKYLNFYGNPKAGTDPREVPPGWDEWRVPVLHTEFQVYGYTLNENGRLRDYGDRPADYSTDVFARKSATFIERAARGKTPFFLTVTPGVPHTEGPLDGLEVARNPRPAPRDSGALADLPFPRPASYAEADRADKPALIRGRADLRPATPPDPSLVAEHLGRTESLLAVDRLVGDVVAALRRSGELDDTYVIFTSDNGYLLGEHGHVGKHLPYEEAMRVPLVMRGPGIPPGERVGTLAQNIDLAPTILEASGAAAGHALDGVSLLPAARGEDTDPDRHLLFEYLVPWERFAAVRSPDGFTYVEYEEGGRELYDLDADPLQLENLAGDPAHRDVEDRLANRLEDLRDCAGETCR
jgi:arylsulfatase A-like enzyme